MLRVALLFLSLYGMFSQVGISQPSRAFNFQSVLLTDQNTPINNKTVELQASIITSNSEQIYLESHITTTSEIGYFSIDIGHGTTLRGRYEDIDWGRESYFLKIELIEQDVTKQIGEIELLSVPYALLAHYAEDIEFEGPMGPQGYQGRPGEKGQMGPIGPCGPQGPVGPKGPIGPSGEVGEIGDQGQAGEMIMVKSPTAPSSPWKGQIYIDDGTNTSNGEIGLRYFDGENWQDI